MEDLGTAMKGMYRDILNGPDGSPVYDSGWVPNTIVDSCRVLLAGFMKNELSSGIQYLAVGQGDEAWDRDGTPAPEATATGLVDPHPKIIKVADENLELVYLGRQENERTSRLQITATFKPGFPAPEASQTTYPLREFGLFGGDPDGNGYMINCVRHPVIPKHKSNTLVRIIRLYF